jgi:hypothetical protein
MGFIVSGAAPRHDRLRVLCVLASKFGLGRRGERRGAKAQRAQRKQIPSASSASLRLCVRSLFRSLGEAIRSRPDGFHRFGCRTAA